MINDDEITADAILSYEVKSIVPRALKLVRTTLCEEVIRRHLVAEALHQVNQARQRMFMIMAELLLIAAALVSAWWP